MCLMSRGSHHRVSDIVTLPTWFSQFNGLSISTSCRHAALRRVEAVSMKNHVTSGMQRHVHSSLNVGDMSQLCNSGRQPNRSRVGYIIWRIQPNRNKKTSRVFVTISSPAVNLTALFTGILSLKLWWCACVHPLDDKCRRHANYCIMPSQKRSVKRSETFDKHAPLVWRLGTADSRCI